MVAKEVHFLTICEASQLLRQRELSPVELTQACLERIDTLNDRLCAYVTLTRESALGEARAAEREFRDGIDRGPMQGIPCGVKDLYATKGVRTTAHSRVLMDWIPQEDATAIARLRAGGAILLGKLAMHEFAYGGPAMDGIFPPARNPWDLERIPGGSSSGSGAAVATGLCYGSLGSDTGGSIRSPAAICGIVGLKPTYGRVSRYGVIPLSWSLDHAGPLTRTVEDAAIMLQVIAGFDPKDQTSSTTPVPDYLQGLTGEIKGLRLGLLRHLYGSPDQTEPEILGAVERAVQQLATLGASVEEVTIQALAYAHEAGQVILQAEAFAYHEANLRRRPQDFGVSIRDRFRLGGLFLASDYIQAQRARMVLMAEMSIVLEHVDVLVLPTFPEVAPRFADYSPERTARGTLYTRIFNLTGHPAITVPCGFTSGGLPIGLQLAGRPFEEGTILRVAYAYQEATSWHRQHPPL